MKKTLVLLIIFVSILIVLDYKGIDVKSLVMDKISSVTAGEVSGEALVFEVNSPPDEISSSEFISPPPIDTPVPVEVIPAVPQTILSTGITWPVYREEPGLTIYKEVSNYSNYLFVIDPTQKNVNVQNGWGRLDDQWDKAVNPACVFNGTYYEPNSTPTFPLIINGQTIPGLKTGNPQYEVRILYVNQGNLSVSRISSNDEVQPAEYAIAGISPRSAYVGVTNHILLGVKDNLLYVSVTQTRSSTQVGEMLVGFGIPEANIIALDAGLSASARCGGEDFLVHNRIFANALVISNK